MTNISTEQPCKQCGAYGPGKYCNVCGQPFAIKRLTISNIVHEVFHFFTHLDRGFPYTLKRLIIAPGQMQKEYVEGNRGRHQKPFSMFFLCATFAALVYYWINLTLMKYYNAGNPDEASFFHQYMVILQIVMLPVYTLLTYLFFYNSKYYYAEILILILYSLSLVMLFTASVHLLKFIWPHLQTRYVELPPIIIYTIITNKNFFNDVSKSTVIIKTIFVTILCFLLAGVIQDWLIDFLSTARSLTMIHLI